MSKEDKLKVLMADYATLVKKNNLFPTTTDLSSLGWSRDQIRSLAKNMTNLRGITKEQYPDAFSDVVTETHFTAAHHKNNLSKLKTFNRFVVTTAVSGAKIDKQFYSALKLYCKVNKAVLIVIPCMDRTKKTIQGAEWNIDGSLHKEIIAFRRVELNSSISILPLMTDANSTNPAKQLKQFGKSYGSVILNSPKQNLEYVATKLNKLPHAIMTTGAITQPSYRNEQGIEQQRELFSDLDHVIGAIVVEIEDDEIYHFRTISQPTGQTGFYDLGKAYGTPVKQSKASCVVVFGDYHTGSTDAGAKQSGLRLVKQVKAAELLLHDFFDGASCNHHESNRKITLFKNKMSSIEEEGKLCAEELQDLSKYVKTLTMVESNHNEFLSRYLQEARFINDMTNYRSGLELSLAMIDGKNPVKSLIEKYLDDKTRKKINWLKRDQSYEIGEVELGSHGDKGPNGSGGTKASVELSYSAAVIGHSHTPGILRRIYQVGTKSLLNLNYTVGPSSWMHTDAIVYTNGQVQLINHINGKYAIDK